MSISWGKLVHISVPITMHRGVWLGGPYLPAPSIESQYSLVSRRSYSLSPPYRIQSGRQQDRARNSWVSFSLGMHNPEMREEQMPDLHNCEVGSQLLSHGAVLSSNPRFLDPCVLTKNTASQRDTLTSHVPDP